MPLWPTALFSILPTATSKIVVRKKGDRQQAQLPCSNRPPAAPHLLYGLWRDKNWRAAPNNFDTIAASEPPTRRFMGGTVVSKRKSRGLLGLDPPCFLSRIVLIQHERRER